MPARSHATVGRSVGRRPHHEQPIQSNAVNTERHSLINTARDAELHTDPALIQNGTSSLCNARSDYTPSNATGITTATARHSDPPYRKHLKARFWPHIARFRVFQAHATSIVHRAGGIAVSYGPSQVGQHNPFRTGLAGSSTQFSSDPRSSREVHREMKSGHPGAETMEFDPLRYRVGCCAWSVAALSCMSEVGLAGVIRRLM